MLGRIFNRKPTPLTPAAARALAMSNTKKGWKAKYNGLQDCLETFDAGQPDALRAFLYGYLEFKRVHGSIDAMLRNPMDEGLRNLIALPMMQLLERQTNIRRAIEVLTQDVSAYYRQMLLDITLRQAVAANSWVVIEPLLDAGAEVNTCRGRPLHSALLQGYDNLVDMLIARGADTALPPGLCDDSNRAVIDKALERLRQRQMRADLPAITGLIKPSPEKDIIKKHRPGN